MLTLLTQNTPERHQAGKKLASKLLEGMPAGERPQGPAPCAHLEVQPSCLQAAGRVETRCGGQECWGVGCRSPGASPRGCREAEEAVRAGQGSPEPFPGSGLAGLSTHSPSACPVLSGASSPNHAQVLDPPAGMCLGACPSPRGVHGMPVYVCM